MDEQSSCVNSNTVGKYSNEIFSETEIKNTSFSDLAVSFLLIYIMLYYILF